MQRNLFVLLLVLAIASPQTPAKATSVLITESLQPIADAFVRQDLPHQSGNGSGIFLKVRGGDTLKARYSFMKFDLSGIDGDIVSAELKVRVAWVAVPDTVLIYHVPDTSWSENGITWNNMNISGVSEIASFPGAINQELLTIAVDSSLLSGGGLVAFGLATLADGDVYLFRSRESSFSPPLLEVTYNPSSLPVIDVTAQNGKPLSDFPETTTEKPVQRTYIIHNQGDADLTLSNPVVSGNGYSLTKAPAAVIGPAQTTTFDVQLEDVVPGPHEGHISIANNDPFANPFSFDVIGQVKLPPCKDTSGEKPSQPKQLTRALLLVLQGNMPECDWEASLSLNFSAWPSGSANNPVLAAAVELIDTGSSEITNWWHNYLRYELGLQSEPESSLGFFSAHELTSNYQRFNATAVLAVHYWAHINNDSILEGYARRYLRATWAIYALAAGRHPVKTFHDRGLVTDGKPGLYNGPHVALAGARSLSDNWVFPDRGELLSKAVDFSPRFSGGQGSSAFAIRQVVDFLLPRWNDVFGLTDTEKGDLRDLFLSDQVPSVIGSMLSGIKTYRPLHLLGWSDGIRASLIESNPVGHTAALFGIVYYRDAMDAMGREGHMIYPWNRSRESANIGTGSSASLDLDAHTMQGTNGPGTGTHPEVIVTLDLPESAPLFHFTLTPSGLVVGGSLK